MSNRLILFAIITIGAMLPLAASAILLSAAAGYDQLGEE